MSAITPTSGPPGSSTTAPNTRAIATKADHSAQSVVNNIAVTLAPGWNGVGFQAQQLTALTPGAGIVTLSSYNGTTYVSGGVDIATVNSGSDKARRGFWIFNASATNSTLTYSGNDDGQGNFVNLTAGWNLVSFCTSSDIPGSQITATVNGASAPLNSAVVTQFTEIQADNSYVQVDVAAGGSVKPSRAYWVFALTGGVRLNLPATSNNLVLTTTNVTTVRGSGFPISGTINGVPQVLDVSVANPSVATVFGNGTTSVVINGTSVGTTTFTATGGGQSVTGNVNVFEGTLQSLLVVPANALTVDEGSQTQFGCNATYATTGGPVTTNATTQCLWIVTNSADGNNRGEIISFDNGAGNFTATRGAGGAVQVGAMLSSATFTAVQNTSVTVNKTNPTIVVRPANTSDTTSSKIPLGGWSRLYEAEAQYPSGFKKILMGQDVTFSNTSNSRIGAINQFTATAGNTGRCEVVTNSAVHPNNGSFNLTAVYNNSASGTQSGSHTINMVTYTLQMATASLAEVPAGGRNIIPGMGAAATSVGYVRPLTVTATFNDKVAGTNFDMALFTNPLAASAAKAGTISIYLPPALIGSATLGNTRQRTDNAVRLYTAGITPVGYTHLLRNITTSFFNPATASPLNVRVQYKPSRTTLTAVGPINGTEIVTGSSALGGISDTARTAALNNFLLDGTTTMNLTVGSRNLARGAATNATLTAQYGIGGTEDVTALSSFGNGGATNTRVGDRTTGFGEVKGRVANAASTAGSGLLLATINAKFPNNGFGNRTITVNSTGP